MILQGFEEQLNLFQDGWGHVQIVPTAKATMVVAGEIRTRLVEYGRGLHLVGHIWIERY